MHGLSHHQAELLRGQVGFGAFFHAKRGNAQRLNGRLHAGNGGHAGLDGHVVSACGATANAHTLAAAHVAVVGGAACHGQVHVGAGEQARRGGLLCFQPRVQRAQNALSQHVGFENAAVQQHGSGVQKARIRIHGPSKAFQLGGGTGLATQQGGQVAGDTGVLRVGQAQLRQAAAGARGGACSGVYGGEEAFQNGVAHLVLGEFGADGAANEFGAPAGHHDGLAGQRGVAQQRFFGAAARVGEGAHLPRVKRFALGAELARHHMRQGQVHVVAAEQDVVAHGDAVQLQQAVALQHGDE